MSIELSLKNRVNFSRCWQLDDEMHYMLGQCSVYSQVLNTTPIDPKLYTTVLNTALVSGVHATAALDENTLDKEEIKAIKAGEQLPLSKAYRAAEVRNLFEALDQLLEKKILDKKRQWLSPDILKKFHLFIGKGLGDHWGTAGAFHQFDGVAEDITGLCAFLKDEFQREPGRMPIADAIVMAIVTHAYLVLQQPFANGNGRTARLAELYILTRGGLPDIALTTLSCHYFATRKEYEHRLFMCRETGDLTDFLRYAITGLRDGMDQTLATVQHGQLDSAWREYIFRVFDDTDYSHKEVLKRRRSLALEFPLYRKLSLKEIAMQSIKLAHMYSGISEKTLSRDVEELQNLGLLGYDSGRYFADIARLNPMLTGGLNTAERENN
jgi:Fic family protein